MDKAGLGWTWAGGEEIEHRTKEEEEGARAEGSMGLRAYCLQSVPRCATSSGGQVAAMQCSAKGILGRVVCCMRAREVV